MDRERHRYIGKKGILHIKLLQYNNPYQSLNLLQSVCVRLYKVASYIALKLPDFTLLIYLSFVCVFTWNLKSFITLLLNFQTFHISSDFKGIKKGLAHNRLGNFTSASCMYSRRAQHLYCSSI